MSAILFDAPRVRDRRPTTTEIVTNYTDDGRGLPILVILSGWSNTRRRYDRKTSFRCEEVPTPLGRGFVLHRNADDVAADGPDADDAYQVLVAANGQDHTCTCRGYQAHGRCRHHDAVRALLEAGHIDHPGERPADPTPSLAEAPF